MRTQSVFITGDDGFVGRRFREFFEGLNWEVDGCDLTYGESMRDLLKWIDAKRFDLVIHCAFHIGGRAGIDGTNVNAAMNMQLDGEFFEWVMCTRQKNVVYFSSSAAYPVALQNSRHPNDRFTLHEDDINLTYLGTISPPDKAYGWVKLTAERELVPMAREFGVNVNVFRPFSGYGSDQSDDYPYMGILRRAAALQPGEDLVLWGPEGQTRDWIHVDDIVLAVWKCYLNGVKNATMNLATGIPTTFGALAQTALAFLKKDQDCRVVYDLNKPTGVFHRVGSPRLMNTVHTATLEVHANVCRTLYEEGKRNA
jgi:nucleoside-diphosphate-sugar epimerase